MKLPWILDKMDNAYQSVFPRLCQNIDECCKRPASLLQALINTSLEIKITTPPKMLKAMLQHNYCSNLLQLILPKGLVHSATSLYPEQEPSSLPFSP